MPKKSMIKEYFNNLRKYEKTYGEQTILLWQCGSFYEVYGLKDKNGNISGSKIIEFANILEIIVADKKNFIQDNGIKKGVIMAGNGTVVPLEKYVPKLNNAGYTVVVWNEIGDDPIYGGKERKEMGVFSVGTNFDIPTRQITNNISCIWIERFKESIIQKTPRIFFGCSTIDIYTGKVIMFQYKYESNKLHEPCVFDELERFMSIYNPKETIIIHNYDDDKKITEIMQFIDQENIKIHNIRLNDKTNDKTVMALKCEKQIWQQEILKKFYKIPDFNVFFESHRFKEYSWATQSFVYLLNFVEKHNNHLVENLNPPEYDKSDDKVYLATHSLKQLNIISNTSKSKMSSLERFLNNCYTNMGKRLFRHNILHPNFDEEYLQTEYNIIEYILQNYRDLEIIRKNLHSIKDIEKLERKLILKKINPFEIVEIYKNTETLIDIMQVIDGHALLNQYVKDNICDDFIYVCKHITKFLKKYINFKLAAQITKIREPINFFKKNIFNHLDNNHREHVENEQKLNAIQKFLSSIIEKKEKKKSTIKSLVKIHETPKSGIWLQATSKRCTTLSLYIQQLKSKEITLSYVSKYDKQTKEFIFSLENFKCVSTSKNNKKIQSITLNNLYDSILQSSHILFEVIEQCYNEFIGIFKQYSDEINKVIKFAGLIDFVITKAYNAREYNYCKPIIDVESEKSYFDAKEIRHPLIEHINLDELYQPNDIALGNYGINGTLLYGTNAVGKSSLIKSIGMSIIMAQAGMYVPCSSFIFKPYKIISTRILGNDNFFKGLSSFAVEMSELKTILNIADKNTLVLGDELCSGTEIKSALSIFAASLLTLYERESSYIFATHLHELQRSDEIINIKTLNMKHMRVEYNAEQDKLIYMRDLRDGPGNNMYGLEVCKSLGLKDEFIEMANNIRFSLFPEEKTLLSKNLSSYNSKKIKNKCEFCENEGEEVHHLNPQEMANNLGNIRHFKKNHKANLVNICKKCHKKITKNKIIHKITKTSFGYELIEQ